MADTYPDRVRSLIYVDPSFRSPEPAPAGSAAVWSFLTAILTQPGWPDEQLGDFLHPERFPDWPDSLPGADAISRVPTRPPFGTEGQRRRRPARRGRTRWKTRSAGARRLGTAGPGVPYEESAALLDAMPRARLVTVDDSGHLPQWEQPAVFNAALLAFLRALNERPPHEDRRLRMRHCRPAATSHRRGPGWRRERAAWAGDAEGGAPFVEADPSRPDRVVGFDVDIAVADRARSRPCAPVRHGHVHVDRSVDYTWRRGHRPERHRGYRRTTRPLAVTVPYYEFREVLAVRDADADRLRTLEDFAGGAWRRSEARSRTRFF